LGSTENPERLIARSFVTRVFAVAPGQVHIIVSFETTNKFKSGFIRANKEFRKRFSFIIRVEKSLNELHSMVCIVLIHSVEQRWYVLLIVSTSYAENAMNAGFRTIGVICGRGGQAGGRKCLPSNIFST